MALLIATVGLTGCQQTAPSARNHNSLFDFSQRPRFFGASAVQNPLPQLGQPNGQPGQLPQVAGSGIGGLSNPLAGIGNRDVSGRTPVNRPFGYIFGNRQETAQTPTPANGIPTSSPQQYQQFSQMANQVNALNQRASAFDSDNQLLNTEVAGLKQKLELANQYNQTLKEQLADTSGRIQQSEIERNKALAQAEQFKRRALQFEQQQPNVSQGQFAQVSSQPWQRQGDAQRRDDSQQNDRFASSDSFNGQGKAQFASATIRANNSLMRRLNDIDIPGGEARMDGDVIRIEFPSDRMFVSGSYQIAPSQRPVLSDIVSTVRRSFPRQIIGVEAHWDNTPLNPPGTTDHQLTATQSLAVFEELIRLGLPERQMFTMAMASNRPRHPAGSFGGVSPNRRIELVIYPESFDGS